MLARPTLTRAGRGHLGRLHAAYLRGRLARLQSARQGGTCRSPSRAWTPAHQALAARAPETSARYRRNGHSPAGSHRVAWHPGSQHTHPSHTPQTLSACAGRPTDGHSRPSPADGWCSKGRFRLRLLSVCWKTQDPRAGCHPPCRLDRRHTMYAALVAHGGERRPRIPHGRHGPAA